jgi:hypothetical protein
METVAWRSQLRLVGLGYGAVLVFATAVLFGRHLQELQNPVDAAGGMWAFGDAILWIFLACLFMVPTAFLVWVMSKSESVYRTYSRFLLGLSLSAPVSLALFALGRKYFSQDVSNFCLVRLGLSPFILLGIGVSWLVARFDRAKRLVWYALLVEGFTFASAMALFIHSWGGPRH